MTTLDLFIYLNLYKQTQFVFTFTTQKEIASISIVNITWSKLQAQPHRERHTSVMDDMQR